MLIPTKSLQGDDCYIFSPNFARRNYRNRRWLPEKSNWLLKLQFSLGLQFSDLSSMQRLQTFLDSKNVDLRGNNFPASLEKYL